MKVEIRSNAFECSSAIEDHRAKPRGMGAWAHDADVAFVPIRPRRMSTFLTNWFRVAIDSSVLAA